VHENSYESVTVTAADGYVGFIHVNILLYRALFE